MNAEFLQNLEGSKSEHNSKSTSEAGVVTVINSERNGKRIEICNSVMTALGNPPTLNVGFIEGTMVMGESLPNCNNDYTLRQQGKKAVIYNAGLVQEVTEHFNLDFSNGRVSRTLPYVDYMDTDVCKVAIISFRKPGEVNE